MEKRAETGLAELHRLLLDSKEVQEQIERGPRQLKVRQQTISQKQAELDAQRQKHKTLRMSADQRSLQLKSNETKIADLKVKLNQAASNREFDIIRAQIEADTVANSVLEDEILDALEKVDAAQIDIKRLEEELARAKADETLRGGGYQRGPAGPAVAARRAAQGDRQCRGPPARERDRRIPAAGTGLRGSRSRRSRRHDLHLVLRQPASANGRAGPRGAGPLLQNLRPAVVHAE